jgi:hypothetical protein
MTRMSRNVSPQDESAFENFMKASTVIGTILAVVLVTMAVAGSNSVQSAQAGTYSTDAPELSARERSGIMTGYQVLL